jgi:aminodeoxyfutalosine deaminase
MTVYRARWVLPIAAPPIDEGWVAVDGGRVAAVGAGPVQSGLGAEVDLGRVALLPALVNAHTHLELSYLAGRVPPAARFTGWIREVMRLRREHPDPADAEILFAQAQAVAALRRAGVGLVGDIGNTLVSVAALRDAGMAAAVFHEVLRFRGSEAGAVIEEARRRMAAVETGSDVRVWLAPHAPYSVSPPLFRLIAEARHGDGLPPTCVHLGESEEEVEFLATGGGPFRTLLEDLGTWDDTWTVPRARPVEYLDALGALDRRTLVVHGVQLTDAELARVRHHGATVVTCPRSNAHVGVGAPPVARFYASGVAVAIGTDSLASAPDLGIFPELAAVRRLAPGVPAGRLLESATRTGAQALGFADWGTIEPGARAALIAVDAPGATADIEEYLVSGIEDEQVRVVSR